MRIKTKDLSQACAAAYGVLPSRSIKPVLDCFLLTAEDGTLSIQATDLEIAARLTLPVEDGTDATFLLGGELLNQIVGKTTAEEMTIIPNGEKCRIESGNGTFDLLMAKPEEFPKITESVKPPTLTIQAKELASIVQGVKFSVCKDGAKSHTLGGIALLAKDGQLHAFATDGAGLAWAKTAIAGGVTTPMIVAPVKAMETICTLGSGEEEIEVWMLENEIRGRRDGNLACGRLIEGNYPSFDVMKRSGMGVDPKHAMDVLASDLFEALCQLHLIMNEETRAAHATFDKGKLTLKTESATGLSVVTVAIENRTGGKGEFVFDLPKLLVACKVPDKTETITLGWDGKVRMSLVCGEWSFWLALMD